jgi:hypothetical protein
MLHHCRAVARGAKHPLLIGDMPFMSYHLSTAQAVENAGRFLKEGYMEVVKLEGGQERAQVVRAIVDAGVGRPRPTITYAATRGATVASSLRPVTDGTRTWSCRKANTSTWLCCAMDNQS